MNGYEVGAKTHAGAPDVGGCAKAWQRVPCRANGCAVRGCALRQIVARARHARVHEPHRANATRANANEIRVKDRDRVRDSHHANGRVRDRANVRGRGCDDDLLRRSRERLSNASQRGSNLNRKRLDRRAK